MLSKNRGSDLTLTAPPESDQQCSSSLQRFISPILHRIGLSGLDGVFRMVSGASLLDSAKWFLIGGLAELGRRVFHWALERFHIRWSTSATFQQGDPSYDWIVTWLTNQGLSTSDFAVSAKSSQRKWVVPGSENQGSVDIVPTYGKPRLFQYQGYWVEVQKQSGQGPSQHQYVMSIGPTGAGSLTITIYTLDLAVLSRLIEEARIEYVDENKMYITVHTSDSQRYGPNASWGSVKRKNRRPFSSVILEAGVADELIADVVEFFESEAWYTRTGIPHRRGILLAGPPGTGKTSTIYAMAGQLNLEIYTLSLSSPTVDDAFLQAAAASVPKNSILLVEDIDVAFSTREDTEESDNTVPLEMQQFIPRTTVRAGSRVTLSGLLNVIDGVGSEEGRLFMATTNYPDRLDPALLRPGRIDRKVFYCLASREQARALFLHFFPSTDIYTTREKNCPRALSLEALATLAENWVTQLPEPAEFSVAELQGYLLRHKTSPTVAAGDMQAWVESERGGRRAKAEREQIRKEPFVKQAAARKIALNEGGGTETRTGMETGDAGSMDIPRHRGGFDEMFANGSPSSLRSPRDMKARTSGLHSPPQDPGEMADPQVSSSVRRLSGASELRSSRDTLSGTSSNGSNGENPPFPLPRPSNGKTSEASDYRVR